MANKNPKTRVSNEDNTRLGMYPLPIKKGYYDKYPDAMNFIESSVYGKNEIILQALQYIHDSFSIDIINRDSVKALSTAMGYDKNGHKIEAPLSRRKNNHSFPSNLISQEPSSSQPVKELQVIDINGRS